MSYANMGWLFYKELYDKGEDDKHIKKTLEKLLNIVTTDKSEAFGKHGFTLTTQYPGLIIGSGYTHGISSAEDTKMGFYFDHTMGLPIIQGSSVKGVLRSLFGIGQNGGNTDKYEVEKTQLIQALSSKGDMEVEKIAKSIFEGLDYVTGKPMPMYTRDTFYDATIERIDHGALMQDDYITPHDKPLKNPIPIKILKVAGGVNFRFDFRLHDIKDAEGNVVFSSQQKEELFLQLLLWHGVGAKTNVGYGQFKDWDTDKMNNFKLQKQKNKENDAIKNATGFNKFLLELKAHKKIDDKMVKMIKNYEYIENHKKVIDIVETKVTRDDDGKYIGKEKFYNQIMNCFKE